MLQSLSQNMKPDWKRALAMLLVLLTVVGMLPTTAFAADTAFAATGDFEVNVAGSTGWNGTRDPLQVYDSESGGREITAIPASDDAAPLPFVILEDNGGDMVKINMISDDDAGTGWVEKKYIFVNLPDVLPSIAYNLTNASSSILTAANGTEISGVTGHQLYAGKQLNPRLDRKEYIVPCMYTLAQRLAKVQKSAMANGETLVIYEAFRPAAVQSAVRDGLSSLIDNDSTVAADMKKASGMGYGQSWFISGGTSGHQAGLSVDMTLAKGDPEELYEYNLDGVTYRKYEVWTEYDMPSAMHELSSDAVRFQKPASSTAMPSNLEDWTADFASSEGAKRLQKYCTDAGLIPLASEWWHFNDPNLAIIMAKGQYAKSVPIHTAGNYIFESAPSVCPSDVLGRTVSRPMKVAAAGPTGGTGGLNPGSPGGQTPTRKDIAWTTDPERTFLRFTLIEFPEGVVTDLNTTSEATWKVKGTPLNVVWGQGKIENWDADTCRKNITWFNSNAMQYNGMGSNAASLMGGTVYAYDATDGYNQRWVTTADEFQAATGISDYEKSQMFHCHASDWSTGWTNGDYTSMWGVNPKPVTPGNEYMVYQGNKAFLYLLNRLTEVGSGGGALPGWSEDVALKNWSEYVHDKDGNLRTKYRIIIETGGIFKDPDGNRRAYTLREMMAYSLFNSEPTTVNHLIYDQTSTIKNLAQYMRQRKDNQFLEYPLDSSGIPTGEELHSTNGFAECDSFVDSIGSPRDIRDTIFNNRRSYGLHILSPFNFEKPDSDKLSLEVTKKVSGTIPGTDTWGFTVTYTAGTPKGFTAKKNDVDCTSEVTDTGSGLKFTLKADETIHIDFDADPSFRFEVTEDDPTYLTDITGTGGTADMTSKKFASSGGEAKATFTNGTTTPGKKPVYLKLKKIAKDDKRALAGAVFSVYADAACSGTVLATMTTGSDGTATTSVPNIVDDGGSVTLYVKETTPPAGFSPLTTVFTATCKAPENSTAAGAVQVGPAAGIENGTDTPTPGKTLLYKRDAKTNKGVGPATFKFSSIPNGVYEFTTDKNGELEPVQWWDPTEKAGRYIKPGEYAVTEIVPPPGYEPTTEVQQIKLELDGSGKPIPAGPLVFKNLAKVGLRIVKYDRNSHQPMEGVTFEIFKDGTSIGRKETDANGEILLTGLEPGTYRAVEVDTGDDGHILDTSWQEVELVAGGGTKDLFFFNDKLPGMKLVKVDSSDPSKTIPGVKFSIRAVSGSYGPEEFITDSKGEIDLSKLPTGSYVVTELECPGYVVDDAQRIIHLRANDTAQFVFTNTKKPSLRLIKTSADGTPLDGVTFRIAKIEDGSRYLDRTTQNGGEILIEDLEPGMYSVQEIATLPDHILDETEHHVELFPGKTSEIRLKNDKRPWLVISKTDKDTGKPVPGVTFTLRGADGPTITTKPTGEDGKITITDLLPGPYTVTEQNVPAGYILDTTPQTVTLFPNREAQVEFQNYQRPTLKIVKVDINGKHLTGAIFEVKTKSGVKIGDFPVGADGTITVPQKHLTEGYYIITEIQAPKGYILDPTPHEVYLRPGKTTEVSIENEKKPSLTIKKLDSVVGDGVKGAKFEIWVAKDKNQYGTYQKLDEHYYYTDENGLIHIDELDTGWYKIKEVEPPEGYMLKEPSEQTVYVEHDKTAVVTFENIPKSALIIRKIDAETGKPLVGAWFRIRYLGGTSGSGGTIIAERETSSNGNIILTGLEAGTYIVEEINAPDGYVIDVAPQTAYISGKSQDCITLTFTNSKNGALLIKKIDSVTKAPLSDVRFFVTTSEGAVVGNGNGYFTTDAAGTILVGDIEPGTTLVVKEVETRPGYILDDAPQTVKIKSNETVTLEFRNQPKGGLIVRKIDSATGKPIAGVEFKIANANGELLPDNEGMTSSNGYYTTDANGQIVLSKLSPGTYVVTETKTLDDYILDATPQTVTVNATDTQTLTFTNTPKGALVVWKFDSVTGEAVKNAVFQIKNITAGAGGNVVGTYKTTTNGSFTVTGLDAGTYVVEEIASDSGHVIDASPQTVNISGDKKEVIQLYFGNAPKGHLLIKKIDSITHEPLSGVEFIVTNSDGSTLGVSGGRYTTDSTGSILVESIAPGTTLVVKETRAKDGYLLDDTPQTAVIKAGQTVQLEFRNQPNGSLIIRKVCSVNPSVTLRNAEFKAAYSDGSLVGDSNGIYRTDENGEIRIDGLTPGRSVVVTETKAPAGFLIDTQPQTAVIQAGKPVSLTFKNQPKGQLIIQKRDSATNKPLPGAEFRVTTAAGCEVGLDGVIGTSTLTQNGIFTTDAQGEIRITNLAPGAYVLNEIKAPDGYVMDTPSTNVVIGTNGDTQTVIIKNSKAGVLVIDKRDSVTNKPLAGVTFKVTTATGEYVPDESGKISSNGLYVTDRDGKITIKGVVGTLVVTETKTIPGYTIDPNTRTQTVVVNPNDTQTLTFYNNPGTTLIIRKFIEGTENEPLSGVAFKVIDGSGAAVGPDDGIYYTDKAGEIVLSDIEPGTTVTAREIKTVEGFVLDGTPQNILIKEGEVQQLTFWNKRDCSLTILKQSTSKEPLTGAVFHVTDEDGGAIGTNNGRYTTDRNGLITITGLQPGQVLIVTEEKAPNGYVKDSTPKTIKIKQGEANSLTFENAKTGSLIINKRSSVDKKTPLEGVTFKITTTNGSFLPDEDGKISSNGLYYTDVNGQIILNSVVGSLVVTEMQSIDGYTISDANRVQTVEVTPDDTQNLYFYNDPLCSLTITKVDSVSGKPVPNTEFTVKDSSGNIIGKYTTGKDGTVTVTGLQPGSAVVVTETKVPTGYVLNPMPQTILVKNGTGNNLTSGAASSGGWSSNGNDLTFENDPTTTLVIQKFVDGTENQPMKGVEFLVTDSAGNVVGPDNGHYYTDKDGRITIKNLEPGMTVTARETRTLPGFILDGTQQSIQIKTGEVQTLTFWNKKAGGLIVRKIDSDTKEPLAGVQFKITYTDGSFVDKDGGQVSSNGIYTTDTNGEIIISGIVGNIVVEETKALPGYTMDPNTRTQTVKINPHDTQTLTFENTKAGGLIVKKMDSISRKPLAGVEFKITYTDGSYVDMDGGKVSTKGIYRTDEEGEIFIDGITGNVVVTETKTIDGYTINEGNRSQTVQINPNDTQTLFFYNDPLCSLTLTKLDAISGKPVPGTEFTVKDGNGNVLGRYTTGKDGTVTVNGLVPGSTLIVVETKVPQGYVLNSTPQTIIVKNGTGNSLVSGGTNSSSGNTGSNGGNDLTFENDPTTTLIIQKYADGPDNQPLKGVEFLVIDGRGTPVGPDNGRYVTDQDGRITIPNLEPGTTITARETRTLAGYILDNSPQTIQIKAGDAQTLTFRNKKAGSLIIKKLDANTREPLAGVEFKLTYADGSFVDAENGTVSSKGLYTTDRNGEITISGITGSITITETRTIDGYTIKESERSQTVQVNANDSQTVTFYNVPRTTLVIQKYGDEAGNTPLAGVEFLVTDGDGAPVGRENGRYITDKDGRIVIEGLADGVSITAKETKTVAGYVLDTTPQTIKIKTGGVNTLTFQNKKAGTLIIKKLDSKTKEPLAGVEFKLTYADGSFVDAENGTISSKGLYTTDRNGEISISGITGTIIVTETRTIDGYTINENERSQTVTVNTNDRQTITFYNTPKQTLIIQKLVTGTADEPLAGVEFLITDSSGATVGPNNGIYRTDQYGRIALSDLTPGTVITAKETKTVDGYVLDGTPQSMEIKSGEVQTLTFYNAPAGGLELIKVDEADKSKRISGATFEIRKMDGGLVDTITTGDNGRAFKTLDAGDYYLVEIECPKEYKLDPTPHYFTVNDNGTATVTVTNKAFSGILIHKIDSSTRKGIYGVTFLLYDGNHNPVDQFTTDQNGYAYVNTLELSGKVYLRELENKGYKVDEQLKTVYVKPGETTEITWENTAVSGQIQITKKSADYNSTNGLPAGTLLEGAVFEIYDKASNLVDTIKSDSRGLAVSRPLPLDRYTIRETKAPANYGVSGTDLTAYLEHEGQILRFEVTDPSMATGVSITKTGPKEVMAGQPVRYAFSGIANSSNVRLDSFYWRDKLPAEVRLETVVTGTYNFPGTYKITYRVNGGEPQTLADNLSTSRNYTLAASSVALGLASNERVTEVMFVFGQAPAGFAQVEKPYLHCKAVSNIKAASFVNVADVGGVYNGVWVQGVSRWVTTIYGKPTPLPRTGY